MTVTKIEHPWAESGNLDTTLTNEKRDTGWIAGDSPDQPTVERFNLLQNETDNKLNDIIDASPKGLAPSSDIYDVIKGVYSDSNCFASTLQSANEIDLTDDITDIAVAIVDNETRLLVAQDLDLSIKVFDTTTLSFVETVSFDSGSLPSPGGAYPWSARYLCADETHVYVVFVAENVSHAYYSEYRVQAYSLSDWSQNSSWSSSGVLLFDTSGSSEKATIINGNDTYLAVIDKINDEFITFAKSDGTRASGAGDFPSGNFGGGIASNGTYLVDSGGFSADISNLSVGCGGTGWPGTAISASGVVMLGDIVYFTRNSTTTTLRMVTTDDFVGATAVSSIYSLELGESTTDGLNIWAVCQRTLAGSVTNGVVKISPHEMVNDGASSDAITDMERFCTFFAFGVNVAHGTTMNDARIVYDGESIWTFDLSVNSSSLFRVPRAVLR